MSYIMKATDLVEKAKKAATRKTVYVRGCFGAPMNRSNKLRYSSNNTFNASRSAVIFAADDSTFGFDEIGFIKGLLWGWNGSNSSYGGAEYASNGFPDISAEGLESRLVEVSNDEEIKIGEIILAGNRIAIYIGDCQAIECDLKGVCAIDAPVGKHGKLACVDYDFEPIEVAEEEPDMVPVDIPEPETPIMPKYLVSKKKGKR